MYNKKWIALILVLVSWIILWSAWSYHCANYKYNTLRVVYQYKSHLVDSLYHVIDSLKGTK